MCEDDRVDGHPILIVEDNLLSRRLLEKVLVKAGRRVEIAKNGHEALDRLGREFFPIVITDWVMPEMDGLELCRTIRGNDYPGYIFLILLTVKDSRSDVIAALEAGADEYLTKPLNCGELFARLNTAKRILDLESTLKRKNEEARILSITDPLTGIYNRMYLNELLPRELKRSSRYNRPLSLILCDIDFFKGINDHYGHQAGDQVLREFVTCLRKSIRTGVDWVARYGGEEFLVVLPETKLRDACKAAERLRRVVSEMSVPIGTGVARVTASFGVAGCDEWEHRNGVTMDGLIEQADRCLYEAKRTGRNRVRGAFPLQSCQGRYRRPYGIIHSEVDPPDEETERSARQ